MIVIGITGTIGAGKGTLAKHLAEQYGFTVYSVREYLIKEINKRGLPVNRDSMTSVANDLRTTQSPSYIVDQLYAQANESGKDSIIESIRTVGEVESLKSNDNFYLFAVDADPQLRYERIKERQSATDQVSFEEFTAQEERESHSEDPAIQNLPACIKMADYVFSNNKGTEAMFHQVDAVTNVLLGSITEGNN